MQQDQERRGEWDERWCPRDVAKHPEDLGEKSHPYRMGGEPPTSAAVGMGSGKGKLVSSIPMDP